MTAAASDITVREGARGTMRKMQLAIKGAICGMPAWVAFAMTSLLVLPVAGHAQGSTCNPNPVVAGSDFTNPAWSKTGTWESISSSNVYMKDDSGDASLSQNVNGVTPSALLTFTWNFSNGLVTSGPVGNQARVVLSYGGVVYWQGLTSQGPGSAPASSVKNGAQCVSGCSPSLAPDTNRTVKIRLPSNIPVNGALKFRLQALRPGTTSDDIRIITPVSIQDTAICLAKTSLGGTGPFNFTATRMDTTMGGGGTTASITTSADGTPVYYDASATQTDIQPLLVLNPGASANITITENPTAGFTLDSVSCSGLNPVRSGNSISIANVPLDTVSTCTFTNRTPVINLRKALGGYRYATGDNFSVAIRTGGVNGTIVSSTANATTTGSGSTVDAGTGTTGNFYTTPGASYTLTEAATSGSLSNYTAALTCSDSAGVMTGLPSNQAFNPAVGYTITPQTGANLSCVITNTPKNAHISLQKALGGDGRINVADQFSLYATGTGAPAAISTTGSGKSITSAPYAFAATAGNTYVLNEAMAAGSASSLGSYNQSVSCTNTGTTNVSGLTTLPITVQPVAGDVISCVVTNTSKTPVIPNSGSTICNADPIISGSDFSNPAWTKTGDWDTVNSSYIQMLNDDGDASMYQSVNGVTPGALLTFTWWFRNGIINAGPSGNQAEFYIYYTPPGGSTITYWSAKTSNGPGSAPASTALAGATCASGCTSLAEQTYRTVQLRLPANVPANGTLQLRVRTSGGTSDDIRISDPLTIKNTGICLVKNSQGGTGKFDFTTSGVDTTMGGGGTTASITTTAANTPTFYDASSTRAENQPLLVKNPGSSANVTITESPATGFSLENVSCDASLTPTRTGNSISIANVPRDTVATCTFTNRTPIINLSKALGSARFAANDNFSVAIRTGGSNGMIVSSTAMATTTGSGATVDPNTGTTGDFYTTPNTTYTLTEAGTSGANLSNYAAKLTCTDSTGLTPSGNLPANADFNPVTGYDIVASAGANLHCVITNTVKSSTTLSGRVFADNGAGGGTAHDGVVNGTEVGLSGVLVRAMNGATVLASATTDADGNFALPLTGGTPVDIVVSPPTGYTAISENVGNTGAANPSVTDSKVSFTPANGVNYSGLHFGEVMGPSFAPDQMRNTTPGTIVFLPHTFVAHTAGTVSFSVIDPAATPNIPGWSTTLYQDSNCNGAFDPGEPVIAGSMPVSDASPICVLLRVTTPAGAPMNAQYQAKVQAVMSYSNSAQTSTLYVNDMVTVAENSAISLIKQVNKNQALPGETLIYTVIYKNSSSAPVSNILIDDATPPYTFYIGDSATCTLPLPPAVTSCVVTQQPFDGAPGTIQWSLGGNLQSGAEGSVKFSVTVSQ